MKRKIDDQRLLELLKEGKLQKEIARELGVSEPAITKRMRRLFPERYQVPESFEKLTEKEKKFVILKARGETTTKAALDSFDCKDRFSAKSLGYSLLRRSDIQESIKSILDQVGLTRLYRAMKLRGHVDHVDPNISLKALDQTWRLDGYPRGKEEEEKPERTLFDVASPQQIKLIFETIGIVEGKEEAIRQVQEVLEAMENQGLEKIQLMQSILEDLKNMKETNGD